MPPFNAKKGSIPVSLRFFPAHFFLHSIEGMPAPLSSANVLQEPPKAAACAIATEDRFQRSVGPARAEGDSLRENKETAHYCDTRDLEKPRLPLHRIALQGENALGHRSNDENRFLSRGDDTMYR